MDKKSKIFFLVLILCIAGSVWFTYYRIVMRQDYIVESQADCDPTSEKCFVYLCDPSTENCTGDVDADTSYYKLSRRKANMIPKCDPTDASCLPFTCGKNETDCEEIFCDAQTVKKGDECNDPQRYVIDHPPVEEENVACDPVADPACAVDPSTETGDSNVSDVPSADPAATSSPQE